MSQRNYRHDRIMGCAFFHKLNGCCMPQFDCGVRHVCEHLVGQNNRKHHNARAVRQVAGYAEVNTPQKNSGARFAVQSSVTHLLLVERTYGNVNF